VPSPARSLSSCSPTIPATVATGISRTIAITSASNSSAEPRPRARPRQRHEPRLALRALDARHPRREERLALEEVETPPRPLLRVARLQRVPAALRAAERRPLRKVDPHVQPLRLPVEPDRDDLPRRGQAERGLEQSDVLSLHRTAPIIEDQKPARQSSAPD
jgi:hypothetical protein